MTPSTELRGITWDHERGRDPLLATAGRFEAETGHPGQLGGHDRFRASPTPRSPLLAETYDLLVLDHPHIGEIVPTGALLALDEVIDAAFIDDQARNSVGPSHASYEWDDHLWALAIDAAGHVSAYRPDLLEQLGVRSAARPGTRSGRSTSSRAEAASGSRCRTRRSTRSRPSSRSARTRVRIRTKTQSALRLATSHSSSSRSCSGSARQVRTEAFGWNPILLLEHMAEADDVVYCPILFGYSNYSRPGFRRNLVRFRPIPSAGLGPRGGVIGGAGLGISARCANVEAARDYAMYVASPEIQQTLYVESGGQPGHRTAWVDSGANELSCSYFADTLPGLEAGYLRPRYDGALARPEQRQ